MPITAGSISVARRINTGDYSHKEAKVEMHFTAEGGEDYEAVAHEAETVAITRLASALATVVKLNETPEIELGAPPTGSDLIKAMENAVVAEKKRHRRTKAEMEAARAGVPETAMPLTPLEQAVMEKAAEEMTPKPHEDTLDWGIRPPPVVQAVEFSNTELDNACGETMHRIHNKPAIQAVIRQYTDGKVGTIPQEQRTEFLSKLKAL